MYETTLGKYLGDLKCKGYEVSVIVDGPLEATTGTGGIIVHGKGPNNILQTPPKPKVDCDIPHLAGPSKTQTMLEGAGLASGTRVRPRSGGGCKLKAAGAIGTVAVACLGMEYGRRCENGEVSEECQKNVALTCKVADVMCNGVHGEPEKTPFEIDIADPVYENVIVPIDDYLCMTSPGKVYNSSYERQEACRKKVVVDLLGRRKVVWDCRK